MISKTIRFRGLAYFQTHPYAGRILIGETAEAAADLPSGKHTKNYGKSQFFMGNLTINGHFQ